MEKTALIPFTSTLKAYLILTKPGILIGNLVTATSGFLLASKGSFSAALFLNTLAGLFLVMAAASVVNNGMDIELDKKMKRTEKRPLVLGVITLSKAYIFAAVLLLIGCALLLKFTNPLTAFLAVLGFIFYIGIYTPLKYKTYHATLMGSFAGAVPPVVGYTATTSQVDVIALLLFALLVLWQMPHFFAIAIYRFQDYIQASIPVLPVVKGIKRTQFQMVSYLILLEGVCLLFAPYTGYFFLIVSSLLNLVWLLLACQGFKAKEESLWARKMFLFSLLVVIGLSFSLAISPLYR